MDGFVNLLEPDRLPSMTKSWHPQIPSRKDRYLSPEELKLSVAQSPRIAALIEETCSNDAAKRKKLQAAIRDILNEIGLARSVPVIRWSGICLNRILLKICTAVHVNEKSLRRLKATIGDQPVLYLPSHRSYLDFVLMSYICFAYDLEIPGIAAGMDFHGMVGVGRLIRKTCAFFMRRTFSTDTLYWQVFQEYMHHLVTVYHTGVEFFIEGTRSRSFKALPPKIGLLSMALEPLFMGVVPDITIVPIGVAYERPLEEQLFAYEMLGVPKPKESTVALFKALKILDMNYGSMYVNFGEPISARDYFGGGLKRFDHAQYPVHVQHLSKPELALITDISQHIVAQQQRLIVLTNFNLISVYYNYRIYIGESTTLDKLTQGVLRLAAFLKSMGALVAVHEHNKTAAILDSLNLHSNILHAPITGPIEMLNPEILNLPQNGGGLNNMKGHQLDANTIRNAVAAFSLQIYSNPCLFWLVRPAFVLLAVQALGDKEEVDKDMLERETNRIRNTFLTEFVLYDDAQSNFQATLDSLIEWQIIDCSTYRVEPREQDLCNLILSAVAPFVCCYYQVTNIITKEFHEAPFSEKILHVATQKFVESAINARSSFVHPYCLSLDSISHALHAFHENGLLSKTRSPDTNESIYTIVDRRPHSISALNLELLAMCQRMPFSYLSNVLVLAKL